MITKNVVRFTFLFCCLLITMSASEIPSLSTESGQAALQKRSHFGKIAASILGQVDQPKRPSTTKLDVIGAAFGRTGTKTTQDVLEILGYPCYHINEVMANPNHIPLLVQAFHHNDTATNLWIDDLIAKGYRATMDSPSNFLYKQQMARFPDAVVLLTYRDVDSWFKSIKQLMLTGASVLVLPGIKFLAKDLIYFFSQTIAAKDSDVGSPECVHDFSDISNVVEFDHSGWLRYMPWAVVVKDVKIDEKACKNRYLNSVKEVESYVPKEKLLKWHPREGWEPLCNALGVSVPNIPFPKGNSSDELKSIKYIFDIIGVIYPLIFLLPILFVYGIVKLGIRCVSSLKIPKVKRE